MENKTELEEVKNAKNRPFTVQTIKSQYGRYPYHKKNTAIYHLELTNSGQFSTLLIQ